ncbi:MAG: hypothetical protein RL521_1065 [Bacteroidota bacterium]
MLGLPGAYVTPILSAIITAFWTHQQLKFSKVSHFLALGLIMVAALVNDYYYDLSFDGQWYHQDAIILLQDGWNPFWDAPVAHETASGLNADYVNHYAKASWLTAQAFYDLLPWIQMSKMANLLWVFASFLITMGGLFRWTQRPFVAGIMALMLALSPASIGQSLSFYVDGQLYAVMLILAVLLADVFIDEFSSIRWTGIVLAFVYLANVKFTGLIYGALMIGILLIAVAFKNKSVLLKSIALASLTFVLGVGVFGSCTYVRNWKEKGHPFYPLMGDNNEGQRIAEVQYPKNFFGKNRLQQWNLATFSYPTYTSPDTHPSQPKTLFKWKDIRASFLYYRLHQPMVIGALGPFSAEIILLLIPLLLLLLFRHFKGVFPWVLLALIALVVIQPECWNYRYAPHSLFVLGWILLFGLLDTNRWIQRYALLLIIGLIANFSICGYEYFRWNQQGSHAIHAEKKVIQNKALTIKKGWVKSMEIRLKEWQITSIEADPIQKNIQWKSFAADGMSGWQYTFVK